MVIQRKKIRCREIKWSNQPILGVNKPKLETSDIFKWEQISGEITKTASYRQTICKVAKKDLKLSIRSKKGYTEFLDEEPVIKYIENLINGNYLNTNKPEYQWEDGLQLAKTLAPSDFELFVANIYTQLGYYLLEPIGGSSQKHTDLVLVTPQKKRLLIQIKARTDQNEFKDYAEIFEKELQSENEEAYFIYHTGSISEIEGKKLKALHIDELLNDVKPANRSLLLEWLKLKCYFGTVEGTET
jgi:hypothetical protein